MALNSSQLTALKNDILSDPVKNAFPNNDDGNEAIAAIYNSAAAPDYWVWRTKVSRVEYMQSTSQSGTVFNFTGNGFIGRSNGELEAWNQLFDSNGMGNPSLGNVRQAIGDIFSGVGNAAANIQHLLAVSRTKATQGQKLYASGAGTTSSPSTMGYEPSITRTDVSNARNL